MSSSNHRTSDSFRNRPRYCWLASLLKQTVVCRTLLIAAAVIGAVHAWGYPIPCMFSQLTGLPCAGCGVTRATFSLLRGDFQSALHYHLFSPLFLLLGALMTCCAIAPKFARHHLIPPLERLEHRTQLPTILGIAIFLYGLLRIFGVLAAP